MRCSSSVSLCASIQRVRIEIAAWATFREQSEPGVLLGTHQPTPLFPRTEFLRRPSPLWVLADYANTFAVCSEILYSKKCLEILYSKRACMAGVE
mmetsp:Transcript_28162/g.69894  ORF Transcript_28162/g.69894 Transcript_28162/m.69894 type:complete len:95 (-) Transcript_28162:326-610(-)